MLIATDSDRKARARDLDLLEKQEAEEREQARKNKGFTQVYPYGFQVLREIIKENPQAASLFSFLAEHIDGTCGAVVASQDFLAEKLGVHERTIRRWIKYLEEDKGVLVKIPVQGRVNAYCLNPTAVWKGYNTGKEFSAFNAKTLVNKDGEIVRRLTLMMTKQGELFDNE